MLHNVRPTQPAGACGHGVTLRACCAWGQVAARVEATQRWLQAQAGSGVLTLEAKPRTAAEAAAHSAAREGLPAASGWSGWHHLRMGGLGGTQVQGTQRGQDAGHAGDQERGGRQEARAIDQERQRGAAGQEGGGSAAARADEVEELAAKRV